MRTNKTAEKYSLVEIHIRVREEDIRAFRDPNGLGRKWYMCQVPVEEIYRAKIEFGPNPRNQNTGTKVFEGIHDTLTRKPAWFLYYSKGIVVNADDASYNNKTKILTIRLRRNDAELWSSPGGNADGGHLQRAIMNALGVEKWSNPTETEERAFVKLEVLTGIPNDELDDLVGARNTNLSVNELSLAVLGEKLDWLIDILKHNGVNDEIAWRQFEPGKEITGQEVLAYLSLLNPEMTERERIRCYSSAGRLISELRHEERLMAGLRKTGKVAFEWLRFVDYIQDSFEDWYEESLETGDTSGFGRLKGITRHDDSDHRLVFIQKNINYTVSKPWMMPIAGAFAQFALKEKPEVWEAVADKAGPVLVERIIEMTAAERFNLNAVGKRAYIWGALAAEVKTAYLQHRYDGDDE